MPVTIITDNKWKDFYYRNQVPAKVLKSQFDWLTEDDIDGFFKYRGYWYHLDDFMAREIEIDGWHGIHYDSMFSGVLIKVSNDGEQYMVGTVYSS